MLLLLFIALFAPDEFEEETGFDEEEEGDDEVVIPEWRGTWMKMNSCVDGDYEGQNEDD